MAGLALQKSTLVGREELKKIKTPTQTKSWHPVSHYEVANRIIEEAQSRKMIITQEKYGVTPNGLRMFAWLQIQVDGLPGYTRSIGFRHGNDKTMALKIMAGASVFVCENMVMAGGISVKRRHTNGIDLDWTVPQAFDILNDEFSFLDERIDDMKKAPLSDSRARLKILHAAENRIIPAGDILDVVGEWTHPRHDEFEPRTDWSLYNCFNQIAKNYPPASQDRTFSGLSKMFALDTSVADNVIA